jgi:hypothetical protein
MKFKANVSGNRVKLAVIGLNRLKIGTIREVKLVNNNHYYKIHWDADKSISSHNYSAKHIRILKSGKQGSQTDGQKRQPFNVNDLLNQMDQLRIKPSFIMTKVYFDWSSVASLCCITI